MADPKDAERRPAAPLESSETVTEDKGAALEASQVHIGAYRILELIGTGGMGDVFLAYDERLRRRVAIKRIRSDAEATPRARQRLRREAEAAAALSHAAIVQVYDIVSDDSATRWPTKTLAVKDVLPSVSAGRRNLSVELKVKIFPEFSGWTRALR